MRGLNSPKKLLLGLQHTLAMFGSTVLVPILTGLNPSVALFSAGVGTLIFHLVTKKKVPVFLGSSFAFIPVLTAVTEKYGAEYAMGGTIVAGLLYLIFAGLFYLVGVERIQSFFPPIVIGPIIAIIGLGLSPVAVEMASENWIVAITVVAVIFLISICCKGFIRLVPILVGIIAGYIVSIFFNMVDFSTIAQSQLIIMPKFVLPKFNISAILSIAPVSFVTILEHLGDINANGAVVGKNFVKGPGLHRTALGDGLATVFAGFVGGPPNTTYSENTGVLATTKVYDPSILRIAAVMAIIMSFIGYINGILLTIPKAVLGGASLVLFGMIASIGFKTIAQEKVDLNNNRNILIMSIVLVIGLGGVVLNIKGIEFSSLSIAAFVGIVLNKIIPEKENKED